MRYEFEIEPFQSHTAIGEFELFDTELADEWQEEVSRSSPAYIRWVQSSLNQILGLRLAVDGDAGPQTRSAIRSFQRQRGLTVDSVVGPQTERALIAAGASPPPAVTATPAAGGAMIHPNVNTQLPAAGPGYYGYYDPSRRYGLPETVQALQAIGAAWQRDHPNGPLIGIGDISLRGGGPISDHKSHQLGVDVDIRLMRSDWRKEPVVYQSPQYSRQLTQELVHRIRANGILPVRFILFNDPAVSGVSKYPNHDNHLHVRFLPPSADSEFAEAYDSEMAGAWQEEVDRGSREYIRWAQSSLNQLLGTRLAVDGISGPQTRSAIRSFQQRQGLAVDGVVGPQTEAALIAAGAGQPPGFGSAPAPPTPPTPPSPLPGGVTPCPVTSPGFAKDRCVSPGTLRCPAIPDLLCVSNVGGIPFEYPTSIGRGASGLSVIRQRKAVTQKFIPSVGKALGIFMANSARFGLPIEAILTYGSLYCRCISDTNTLSNHSFGDAIDIVGIRWRTASGTRETIVHNFSNALERALLRRINACLRLSFATVIDYHRSDHRDHFHCDMNRGGGRNPRGTTTAPFVQEALNTVLGLSLSESGALDAATMRALSDFSGRSAAELQDTATLNRVLDELFTRVAHGEGAPGHTIEPDAAIAMDGNMRHPFNFEAERFDDYSEFDLELETFGADWEWGEEAERGGRIPRAPAGRSYSKVSRPSQSKHPPRRSKRRPPKPPWSWPPRPWLFGSAIVEPAPEGSEYARWVQDSLNRILRLRLPVDGIMGPETRSALRSFQTRQGLPADGIVGPPTEAALIAAAGERPPQAPDAASEFEFDFELTDAEWQSEVNRSSRDYIKWVQQTLNQIMGLRLAVDGIVGPQTRSAIRSFQERQGLGADGIAGPKTEAALTDALAKHAAPATPTPTTTDRQDNIIFGLDTASIAGNKNPNWVQAKAEGSISFAIIRSNWGVWEDSVFKRDWPKIKEASIVRGAYLFLRFPHPKHGMNAPDPVSQAKAVIKTVGRLDESDFPPTIDVEFPGGRQITGMTAQQCLGGVRAAWKVLKDYYGVAPIIYTSGRVWHEDLNDLPAPDLVESPLWLARYPFAKGPAVRDARVFRLNPPPVPPPWGDATNWWIHQYQGDAVRLPGFPTGNVDMNRFNTMRKGATGDRVKWVQRRLGIAQNGQFDAAMDSALRAFQDKKGLVSDGIVAPRTFAYLCWSNP